MGEKRNAYDICGKARKWVDNIKMNIREIVEDGMDCIDLTPDRDQWRALVNTVMNNQVP
jgi:hypothetical protein